MEMPSGVIRSDAQRGTSSYRAPESLMFATFNDRVDIWALGCVLYELISREKAFKSDWDVCLYASQSTKISFPLQLIVDGNAHTLLVNLIHEMLQLRPSSRPSAADLRMLFDVLGEKGTLLPFYSRIFSPAFNQKLSKSRVFSVPEYGRNPFFSGRDDILDTLARQLKVTEIGRYNHCVALYGLAGIGKSQIALEYAYRHEDDYVYVFWISGADRTQLLSGFSEIARIVGCVPAFDNPEEIAKRVLHWLRETESSLIIIDNLDDVSIVDNFLPPANCSGHTIITTRSPYGLGIQAMGLEVTALSRENATNFLLLSLEIARAPENVRSEIGKIVDDLGRLPLAIDHAAAYIKYPENISQFLSSYRAHRQELLSLRLPYSSLYNHTVATTWKMSFELLQNNFPDSADLLHHLAFMNPDEILIDYLRAGIRALPQNLQTTFGDAFKWERCLRSLQDTSLIRIFGQECDRIRIHRLVQAVIQDGLESSMRTSIAFAAVQMGLQAFPFLDFCLKDLEKCRRFRAQVTACLDNTKTLQETPEWLELAERLGKYLYWDGFYVDASQVWRSILEIRRKVFGAEHETTLKSMHELAWARVKSKGNKDALELAASTLNLRQKVLGDEHEDTLHSMNLLRYLYIELAAWKKASEINAKLLDLRKKVLGAEHRDTLHSMQNLARVSHSQGPATETRLETLGMQERIVGLEHPDSTRTPHTLANAYSSLNRDEEAESLFADGLKLRKRVLGPEHKATLATMQRLEIGYINLHRYEEAADLDTEMLEIQKRVLGPKHRETLETMRDMAWLYSKLNRHEEAAALNTEVLEIQKRVLGPEHRETLEDMRLVAIRYLQSERIADAECMFTKTLNTQMRVLGPEDVDTVLTMNCMAELFEATGRIKEAVDMEAKALAIWRKVEGNQHENTLLCMEILAGFYKKLGRMQESEELTNELRCRRQRRD